eukprot:1216717-Alexandrium_andersonii.AAC.1
MPAREINCHLECMCVLLFGFLLKRACACECFNPGQCGASKAEFVVPSEVLPGVGMSTRRCVSVYDHHYQSRCWQHSLASACVATHVIFRR